YVGFNFAPRDWANCDGQLLAISSNTALFSLLGTMYGGDGRTTFALPDLRGRVPLHVGNGAGLSGYSQGQRGGFESVTLNVNQLPSHNHSLFVSTDLGDTNVPATGKVLADAGEFDKDFGNSTNLTALDSSSIGNTGANQSIENRPPYLVLRAVIALQGVFPSRN
ncbi:MAG: phage tail protein, partial [Saprospiraceae bacterium]